MSLRVGDVLAGKYSIVAEIGQGGFGQTYLGHDAGMDRQVAIKELLHDKDAVSPELYEDYKRRFRKEAQVVSKFSHPNVVAAYSLESDSEGDLYLVLEFVDGDSLKNLISQGPLDPARAVAIATDLCSAVEAIWKRDIVHRDIKPSNILLNKEGQAKLTDFGVAQVGHETRRTQEAQGHPGTPAYKSPEQAGSTGYLDQRSDLYAVGLVLYEMLTGELYQRNRVPPRRLNRRVPRALSAVVMKALQENPADRYQSAREQRTALQEALQAGRWTNARLAVGTMGRQFAARGATLVIALAALGAAIYLAAQGYGGTRAEALRLTATAETRRETLRAALLTTATPTLSPTPAFADGYEPDDITPKAVVIGETHRHNFYPSDDVDKISFRVKPGRVYGVLTSGLDLGVDTVIEVSVAGQRYENDDAAGSLASEVYFQAMAEAIAVATISNKGEYGRDSRYDVTVIELPPTPTPTMTFTPSATPTRTGTATVTRTATATRTETPTKTETVTRTPTGTRTGTATATSTRTPTSTITPSPTATVLVTETATQVPTETATELPTPTETAVVTETPTEAPTEAPTETLVPTPEETVTLSEAKRT